MTLSSRLVNARRAGFGALVLILRDKAYCGTFGGYYEASGVYQGTAKFYCEASGAYYQAFEI